MKRCIVGYLITVLCVFAGSQDVSMKTEPLSTPTLSYNCTGDGNFSITVSDFSSYQRMIILESQNLQKRTMIPTSTSKSTCEQVKEPIPRLLQLTGCLRDAKLYVYIMNEKEPKIYGGRGFHEYIFTCVGIPSDGVVRNVTATATWNENASAAERPHEIKSNISLTMTFSPNEIVNIGQQLNLSIQITDSAHLHLYVLPETCWAEPGDSGPDQIRLLTKSTTKDVDIMSNFSVYTGHATATLYAFTFVHSSTVKVACSVHICKDKSCNGAFQFYASAPPSSTTTTILNKSPTVASSPLISTSSGDAHSNRKRRAAGLPPTVTKPSTHLVTATFAIREEENISSGQTNAVCRFLAILAMLCFQRL